MCICRECKRLKCACWVDSVSRAPRRCVHPPPFVPVLVGNYPLNSLGTRWFRMGLNATDGKFNPFIQLAFANGKGVLLNRSELRSLFHSPAWDWILHAYEDPELLAGHVLEVPGGRPALPIPTAAKHQLTVAATTPTTIDVDLTPQWEIDGRDPCWVEPVPHETCVSLTLPEWKVLREYHTVVPPRWEELEKIAVECQKFYARLCVHVSEVITPGPDYVMESIRSDKPTVSDIHRHLSRVMLSALYPEFVERESYSVKCVLEELRLFHLGPLAYSVRELLVDDPKCTVLKCYCDKRLK